MKQSDNSTVLTVSQLTQQIKALLEGKFVDVWVTGEISNYTRHSSGHHYFTIKDDKAELSCTLWRSIATSIKVRLKDGMKVVLYGDVSVYQLRGRYQLNVKWVVEEGIGKLELRFRELKERLLKEGLFDESHKRDLPAFPSAIGIVTSPTGAAVRDMINVLRRRMPSCRIVLCPVAVQGPGAENEIADGIRKLNDFGEIDLMIVGRGGGSLEDLWAFNEETVARAIYSSSIPVISAVGHQVDYTISDFVADLRAPTPSAAAEIAVPDSREIDMQVREMATRLRSGVGKTIEILRMRVEQASRSYLLRKPEEMLSGSRQTVDELHSRLTNAAQLKIERYQSRTKLVDEKLKALSPGAVMQRGYSVCRTYPGLEIVRRFDQVKADDRVKIELSVGSIFGKVDKTAED
jgi:exodeoxyribonuclease VII large subunit